jgi:hypothetical protein
MNDIYDRNSNLAVVIGPPDSPEFTRATERAKAQASDGDRTILDKLFEIRKEVVEEMIGDGAESVLGNILQAVIGKDLKVLDCSIGMGTRDGVFHPSLNIDLHASVLANGAPLVTIIGSIDAEYLGALIGKSMEVEWVRTSITHYQHPFGEAR